MVSAEHVVAAVAHALRECPLEGLVGLYATHAARAAPARAPPRPAPAAPRWAAPPPADPAAPRLAAPPAAPSSPPVSAPRAAWPVELPDTCIASCRHSCWSRVTNCARELP